MRTFESETKLIKIISGIQAEFLNVKNHHEKLKHEMKSKNNDYDCLLIEFNKLKHQHENVKKNLKNMLKTNREVCLQSLLKDAEWVLDSGCSHHMTRNTNLFYTFQSKERGATKKGS
ncbi:hypothetical protein LINGRAHAP2_LOCUS31981 [Linum grandiflorum]